MRTTTAQTTLTHTQAAVLVLLVHRPMSGYDLLQDMDRSLRHFWSPARGQVYAVLPRLADEGLATAREVEQKARPDKVVYTITRAGRAALDAWLDEADRPRQPQSLPAEAVPPPSTCTPTSSR